MSDRDRYLELISGLHKMLSQAETQSFADLNLLKFELEALLGRVSLKIKLKEEVEQDKYKPPIHPMVKRLIDDARNAGLTK